MRRKKEEIDEVEEIEETDEIDEKELKKKKREEKKEKRLKKKKQDKAARWAGTILLFTLMFVGFLLWVSGQISQGSGTSVRPVASPDSTFPTQDQDIFFSPEPADIIIR